MTWYAAHAIMVIKFKNGVQNKYPFWENIFLVKADSVDEAFEKAETRARQDEGDSQGSFTHEGRPASWVFGGLRRLVTCVNSEEQPTDGTEITYSEMEVSNETDFAKLINGELVTVWYG